MSTKIYLWIEDHKDKAGYVFWETLMHQLDPNIIVESKGNNSELVKAVGALPDCENKYIIVFDNSFDNLQAYQERRLLKKYAEKKSNVHLLDVICFEFILLEFDKLMDWLYAPDDEFREKRSTEIRARELLLEAFRADEMNYKGIQEIVLYDDNLKNHNIEQLSAKLLFDLTRNTGFEVSKKNIGDCWICSCCEWVGREKDDVCGLDSERLSLEEKMKSIYIGTSLASEFGKARMELGL
ncbi:MAG: hypothetical protein NC432_05005 [Roseburia sp.]|nr:hypothetical protein [Roseburia sp.]MCM1098522.1 hypothetical protein [Ruminococcus flavefaciens]